MQLLNKLILFSQELNELSVAQFLDNSEKKYQLTTESESDSIGDFLEYFGPDWKRFLMFVSVEQVKILDSNEHDIFLLRLG